MTQTKKPRLVDHVICVDGTPSLTYRHRDDAAIFARRLAAGIWRGRDVVIRRRYADTLAWIDAPERSA
jgi:hypothetical protein